MATALSAADLYHVGVVVTDFDAALQRLTAAAGYQWTQTMEHTVPVLTADGPADIPFKLAYSLQAPHVEILQEVPDTPWVSAARNAVHHLGYWTDDVAATGAALEDVGYTWEVRAAGDAPAFAYYLDPLGVRIELVNRAMFGDWTKFLQQMKKA
ncbi:VOC family protein [[Mycobacterium] wendilense]|uniref:VOC family protein n=1 Tax=[Mycobacterium] wendilense TaxID=3064284 RepID=A0ABM9MIU9_9MYCO|nr:VOC family protein [Mycolicibacterium sp. MU0050]CAJ1586244.1 VOC family protein [Mycolicibacterium sp. MU0050]